MKKIFAIALALVMVLSMASAFASYCTGGFDWTCATDSTYCGQGKVEVIPYVKANNACGGFDWQVSECASAVNSEKVYYALKLTVDEYADAEWWTAPAEVTLSYKGLKNEAPDVELSWKALTDDDDFEEDEVNVFYYDFEDEAWDIVNDDFELENSNVRAEKVKKAADAKVCAKLTSEDAGMDGIVGDYYVEYVEAADAVAAKEATAATITYTFKDAVEENVARTGWKVVSVNNKTKKMVVEWTEAGKLADEKIAEIEEDEAAKDGVKSVKVVNGAEAAEAVEGKVNALYVWDNDKEDLLVTYIIKDGKIRTIQDTPVCGEASYATIKDFFGLEIGTCVDADLIADNFGWDFEQESCFSWSDKALSIVDAECVVAIPKTGDASVLAWLF